MEFNIDILAVIEAFGLYIAITESMRNAWIIMAVLILFAIFVRVKLSKFEEKPKGFQNFIELLVETFDRFVANTAGRRLSFLSGWFFSIFLFIALSNISGLFFMRPPTADWAVTFPMAFVTFLLIQGMALKYQPKDHIKGLFEPIFLFFPLNVMGEIAKPISLSFRLFGNVLGGMILLTMIYGIAPFVMRATFPIFLHAYFDLASGLLQAYVFVVLSLAFIGASAGTSSD